MPMGGLIMASVPAGGWRPPMENAVPGPGPRIGGSPWGAIAGASRVKMNSGRARMNSNGRGQQGRTPKHISRTEYRKGMKFKRVKASDPPSQPARPGGEYRGKHRDPAARKADAKRTMKRHARGGPKRGPLSEHGPGKKHDPDERSPGAGDMVESMGDEISRDPDTDGAGRSTSPRKPMREQQAPGREMPVD